MTNRKSYHKRTAADVRERGRYVSLTEYMLASPAWQALACNSRALYIELARRYRGPNSNNGKIPYSVREAATALAIGRSTAQRCFEQLLELGFLKIGKRSGFSMKGRVATEWLLTEFPDDTTATTGIASKDFMKWTPQNSFHSPISDTHSPTTEPGVDLRRDRVANEQRLWPCSGTVSPEIIASQSHHKDTIQLPGGSGSAVPPKRKARVARPSMGAEASEPLPDVRSDLLQDAIARRLGRDGWQILQHVGDDRVADLVDLERRGKLDATALEAVRLEYRRGAA
jgi:hypothetical protein